MNRAEFESFLLRYVWRDGDALLATDLPIILRVGETQLARDLMVQKREAKTTLTDIGDPVIAFPADYHSTRLLSDDKGPWRYVTPYDLATQPDCARVYTLSTGVELKTPAGGPLAPCDFKFDYYTTLPKYETAETWVQEDHFDLYLYACLLSTTPYIREDERAGAWSAFYDKALAATLDDDVRRKFNGSPLVMKMPGAVG